MPRTIRAAHPSGSASLSLASAPAGRWHGGVTFGTVARDRRGHSSLSPVPRGPRSHHNIGPGMLAAESASAKVAAVWLDSLTPEERHYVVTGKPLRRKRRP